MVQFSIIFSSSLLLLLLLLFNLVDLEVNWWSAKSSQSHFSILVFLEKKEKNFSNSFLS